MKKKIYEEAKKKRKPGKRIYKEGKKAGNIFPFPLPEPCPEPAKDVEGSGSLAKRLSRACEGCRSHFYSQISFIEDAGVRLLGMAIEVKIQNG